MVIDGRELCEEVRRKVKQQRRTFSAAASLAAFSFFFASAARSAFSVSRFTYSRRQAAPISSSWRCLGLNL